MVTKLDIPAMVNPHSHIREGEVVKPLIKLTLDGGVDTLGPMPNTEKGLRTPQDVADYIDYANSLVPKKHTMKFIPHIMLGEGIGEITLDRCARYDILDAKVYPYERTTLSQYGVKNYFNLLHAVKYAATCGIRIHLHPEHPWLLVPNRDAEYMFLPIAKMFLEETNAIIFWEHGSDARCVPFWKDMARTGRFYVTLTAHHLATHEDFVFGDVSATCKPPIKTHWDQKQLVQLVAENHPWVIAIGDDAPHDVTAKHKVGRCTCGAYTAPFLLPLFAHALSHLLETPSGKEAFINFTSRNARKVFELPDASRTAKLVQKPFKIPNFYKAGPWTIEPFWASKTIDWSLED